MDPVAASQPRVLGRYALYDAIASGGMATVHLGRLIGHVGFERTVAIKRLHPQFAQDPEFVSMFLDEARVVARIRHPNVVPTLDVVAAEGELFIVMEYVQGESLARLIKTVGAGGSRIPPSFAAAIVAGVLHGLHAAHEARSERGEPLGVVHRDISPQNILVGTDGVARILDFGVAKAAGRIQTTREGQLKGKLAYMAPEQISGVVGRASDVYAASVVLWEALTGRRLFAGEGEAHVMKLVLENRISPPSEFVADLPSVLDTLTLRGLALDPGDRFETAREMALALEDALPLVAPSKIGTWVESTASKTLGDRSQRIAIIESSSLLGVPAPAKASLLEAHATPAPASRPARADEEPHTQLSSSSAALPESASTATSARARPTRVALAVGVALAAVSLLVTFWIHGNSSPAKATSPGAAEAPLAPPTSSAAAAVLTAMAPAPSAPADSLAGATPSAAPAPSASSAAATPAPRPSRPPLQRVPASRLSGASDGTSDRK